MSNFPKWIIGLLLWLTLTIASYYTSKQCLCNSLPLSNNNEPIQQIPDAASKPEVIRLPLDFKWSVATAFTNQDFDTYQQSILKAAQKNNILEITGLYVEDEQNATSYNDLGLARANQVKDLFLKYISEERIKVISRKISNENYEENYFKAIEFNWIAPIKNPFIEVLKDKTILRFSYNSKTKEIDASIEQYLDNLVKEVQTSKKNVSLEGHSDNIGDAEVNYTVALRRAKVIRDILIKKGLKRRQIKTSSMGEDEPIASNATEKGRKKNRRVVVRLK